MYLRKLLGKSNISSVFNKNVKRNFSFFKDFNANTLAFRATKYDPTKELEVNYFSKYLKQYFIKSFLN